MGPLVPVFVRCSAALLRFTECLPCQPVGIQLGDVATVLQVKPNVMMTSSLASLLAMPRDRSGQRKCSVFGDYISFFHSISQDCERQLTQQEHLVRLVQPGPIGDVDILGRCARALETPECAYRQRRRVELYHAPKRNEVCLCLFFEIQWHLLCGMTRSPAQPQGYSVRECTSTSTDVVLVHLWCDGTFCCCARCEIPLHVGPQPLGTSNQYIITGMCDRALYCERPLWRRQDTMHKCTSHLFDDATALVSYWYTWYLVCIYP